MGKAKEHPATTSCKYYTYGAASHNKQRSERRDERQDRGRRTALSLTQPASQRALAISTMMHLMTKSGE